MDKNYISHVAESKTVYHKNMAKMKYEDKVAVVLELQKIDHEMIRSNKNRKSTEKFRMLWQIQK